MEEFLNCTAIVANALATTNCSQLEGHLSLLDSSCSFEENATIQEQYNSSNCTEASEDVNHFDYTRGFTLLIISVVAVIGNVFSIALISRFKIHKVPDVLVIGLALVDLATLVPIAMSTYSYLAGVPYLEGSISCDLFGTLAQVTRFASAITVSLISLERYFAVNRPFIYRKYATPKKFIIFLILCWLVAFIVGVAAAIDPNTTISHHTGYCIFDFTTDYAIAVLIYAGIQYVIVLVCFVLVTKTLIKVYRRRKKMKVQGNINKRSRAQDREHEVTFTRANLTSRISDLGKSLKKAAPIMAEKFQLGVEAQFARMLFAVVALFYISWTTTVAIIILAQIKRSEEGVETALFWGIRLTVVSTAINPFLYGLLARQYRLAYVYVIRLVLSKCFRCVEPPLKDVFAAARSPAGEVRENSHHRRRHDHSRYGTQSKASQAGSAWTKSTGVPILTRNTTRTKISIPGEMDTINEEDFLPLDGLIISEHSTHVPSAGELASSVIIPHQARDTNSSLTDLTTFKKARNKSSSLHDLVDGVAGVNFMMELGPHKDAHQGVGNPLAMIAGLHGEDILDRGSEMSSEEASVGMEPRHLYANPVYQLENSPDKSRDAMGESQQRHYDMRQSMVAASSTDDITLVSKKTTRNELSLAQPNSSQSTTSSRDQPLRVAHSTPNNLDLSPAQKSPTITSDYESSGYNPEADAQLAQEIKDQEAKKDSKLKRPKKGKETSSKEHEQIKKHLKITRSQDFFESNFATDIDSLQQVTLPTNNRNSVNIPPTTDIQSLKKRFESPPPPHTSPNSTTATPTHNATTQSSHAARLPWRRSSNGNSDSGRESMTDVVVEPV